MVCWGLVEETDRPSRSVSAKTPSQSKKTASSFAFICGTLARQSVGRSDDAADIVSGMKAKASFADDVSLAGVLSDATC